MAHRPEEWGIGILEAQATHTTEDIMGYFNQYSIRDDFIKPMLEAELPGSKERGPDDNSRIIFFEPASPLLGKSEIRYFKDQAAASRARRAYKGLWRAGPVGYWHHIEKRWIG